MKKAIFIFTARNGKPEFADLSEYRFREHLKEHEGKIYEVYLRENKRTLTQNRFYRVYLEMIEAETGNSADDLHEYFKRKHLAPRFVEIMGKEIKLPASTTTLTKTEFGDYMEKICAECGVPLPDPTEAGFITNY